jgi:hypothetical protein
MKSGRAQFSDSIEFKILNFVARYDPGLPKVQLRI